jgi:predicted RNase H-like HicB family nuclease
MKFFSFQIVIEKEPEDEGYFAYSPTVPGCFSNGKTIEEAKRNMREALEQHLSSLARHRSPHGHL